MFGGPVVDPYHYYPNFSVATPGGEAIFTSSPEGAAWWLIHHELDQYRTGPVPYRYVFRMGEMQKTQSAQTTAISGAMGFCLKVNHNLGFTPVGYFEPFTCRVEQNGNLAITSDLDKQLPPFFVPRGQYEKAYTNLEGKSPDYYLQMTTGELNRTSGYVFPTSYLRQGVDTTTALSTMLDADSCAAGPIVHYRHGVPMIYQQQIMVPQNGPDGLEQKIAGNRGCMSYLDYSSSTLKSMGFQDVYQSTGTATPEILLNGQWIASPHVYHVTWESFQDNSDYGQYLSEALNSQKISSDDPSPGTVNPNRTYAGWGFTHDPDVYHIQ